VALIVRDSIETDVPAVCRHKHNRLPVVEHGRLVGVVTRIDALVG